MDETIKDHRALGVAHALAGPRFSPFEAPSSLTIPGSLDGY